MAIIDTEKIRRVIYRPKCTRIIDDKYEHIIWHDEQGNVGK